MKLFTQVEVDAAVQKALEACVTPPKRSVGQTVEHCGVRYHGQPTIRKSANSG